MIITTNIPNHYIVMDGQGYHRNIPCGATAPLGSSCRLGFWRGVVV